ncbi:hypothetical protein A9977_27585 [Variovorax sp. UMC13]|nr:hypothetical protein [Variovorax sp. UMC13]
MALKQRRTQNRLKLGERLSSGWLAQAKSRCCLLQAFQLGDVHHQLQVFDACAADQTREELGRQHWMH